METLFETKEQYLEMRRAFKSFYNTEDNKHRLCSYHFAIYAILRGKDWRNCFSPNSEKHTIERLETYLNKTKPQYMYLEPFGKTVTHEMINQMRTQDIPRWEDR